MQKNRGYVWLTTLLIVLIIVLIIAGFGAGWLLRGKAAAPKDISPSPKACTMEAKLCPDGSYVGRTGPNCEFAKCQTTYPSPVGECKKDSDCAAGNLCHKNICTSPIGKQCSGPNDTSCPTDFECVQGCGPPVARQDDPPPPYFCELKGYQRMCPICLAKDAMIDTPQGEIAAQDLQVGDLVWTVDTSGKRVLSAVILTSKTPVPPAHQMVHLVLDDGRELFVSPGHPTIDGRTAGDLAFGDLYDGARVISSDRVPYSEAYTYDILPSGETGFYFANGILLGSTLR